MDGNTDGNRNFYFSHDMRPFAVEDLVKSAKVVEVVTVDDEEYEKEIDVDMSKIAFGLDSSAPDEDLSPLDIVTKLQAAGQEFAYTLTPLYIFYEGEVAETQVYIYIGVKGDANLDGKTNSVDAADVLTYAADFGSGKDPYIKSPDSPVLEAFAWFLADVTDESRDCGQTSNLEGKTSSVLNSEDAAYIVVYASVYGIIGDYADWAKDVLEPNDAELPKFTKAIYDWKVENDQ